MRTLAVLPLVFAVACGDSGNTNIDAPGSNTPDASVDAPPSGPTFTISGNAVLRSTGDPVPLAGVVVAAYANADETTPVATTTSGADGHYELKLPADKPLDGFLKATKAAAGGKTYVDTYLYPPTQLAADFSSASVFMVDTSTFSLLKLLGDAVSGQGLVALLVVDSLASVNVVEGATVTSDPAPPAGHTGYTVRGLPDREGTATGDDGTAFLFALTPGAYTVTAAKAGLTFKTTSLKVRADVFTTTLVTQ